MTVPGELARVTGLTRPEAGSGNRALVEEGYAVKVGHGTYRLAALDARLRIPLLKGDTMMQLFHVVD